MFWSLLFSCRLKRELFCFMKWWWSQMICLIVFYEIYCHIATKMANLMWMFWKLLQVKLEFKTYIVTSKKLNHIPTLFILFSKSIEEHWPFCFNSVSLILTIFSLLAKHLNPEKSFFDCRKVNIFNFGGNFKPQYLFFGKLSLHFYTFFLQMFAYF